jgi:hypothetical protein
LVAWPPASEWRNRRIHPAGINMEASIMKLFRFGHSRRRVAIFTSIGLVSSLALVTSANMASADAIHEGSLDANGATSGRDIGYNSSGSGSNFLCSTRGTAVVGNGALRFNNDGPKFAENSIVNIEGTSDQAGITVVGTALTMPGSIVRTGSSKTADIGFTFNTTVALTVPNGTYTVTIKATGKNSADEVVEDSATFGVTVDCPPPAGDTTPPVITITTPPNGATYTVGQTVLADYECVDDESAVTKCDGNVASGTAIDTATVGAKTFTVDAESAGGTSSLTHNYSVVFDFDGFFDPVASYDETEPVWNTVKAGQAVPMKFSLDGDHGLGIVETGFPQRHAVACPNASAALDPVEETATATRSSLRYDVDADQYVYVWKTDKSWANSCARFDLKLIDGTTHSALFKFSR